MFCFRTGIREERPSRDILKEYFAVGTPESRYWHGLSLVEAVQKGLELSARHPQKAPFMWLTAYNSGAAKVALAALSLLGISQQDLDAGFPVTRTLRRIASLSLCCLANTISLGVCVKRVLADALFHQMYRHFCFLASVSNF